MGCNVTKTNKQTNNTNNSLITRHHILGKSACSEMVAEKVWRHIYLVGDYTLPGTERPCKYRAVQGSNSWPLTFQREAQTQNQSVLWAVLRAVLCAVLWAVLCAVLCADCGQYCGQYSYFLTTEGTNSATLLFFIWSPVVTHTNCRTAWSINNTVTSFAISDIPRPINPSYFLSGAYNLWYYLWQPITVP
jgi:hypothetical protein